MAISKKIMAAGLAAGLGSMMLGVNRKNKHKQAMEDRQPKVYFFWSIT